MQTNPINSEGKCYPSCFDILAEFARSHDSRQLYSQLDRHVVDLYAQYALVQTEGISGPSMQAGRLIVLPYFGYFLEPWFFASLCLVLDESTSLSDLAQGIDLSYIVI